MDYISSLYLVMKSHNPLNEEAKQKGGEKNSENEMSGETFLALDNEPNHGARQSKRGERTWTTAVLGGEAGRLLCS